MKRPSGVMPPCRTNVLSVSACLATAFRKKSFERLGVAPSMVRAVKDFVLAVVKGCASKVDLREDKVARESELQAFKTDVKRQFDQVRHEMSEMRQEFKTEIDSKVSHLKVDLIKWMIGLCFAQASLTFGIVATMAHPAQHDIAQPIALAN